MSKCYDCTQGKLSNAERTSCGDCSAGEYVYNDASCELCPTGRYAPSAQEDECLECFAGFHTGRENGSTTCSSCGELLLFLLFHVPLTIKWLKKMVRSTTPPIPPIPPHPTHPTNLN